MKRYTPTLEAFSWANSEDCDTEVHPVMAETPDGAYVKRDEAEAECERLRRELLSFELENVQLKAECERLRRGVSAAREAVGEGWFAGGATLAQAIRRKVHVLECERENRLADEHPPTPVEGPPPGGLLPEMTIDEVRAECERLRRELSESRRGLRDVFAAIGLAERSLCNDRYTAAEHVRILTDKLRMATDRAERAEGRLRVFRENLDMGLGDDVGPEGGAR